MTRWVGRIRAAIAVGLTWAAAWFAAGMLLLLVVGFGAADVPFPLFFGLLGFLAGAAFSVILGLLGRRRRFDQMSLPRFALWGAIGGLIVDGLVSLAQGSAGDIVMLGAIFGGAGAVCASATLALARRADARELPADPTAR